MGGMLSAIIANLVLEGLGPWRGPFRDSGVAGSLHFLMGFQGEVGPIGIDSAHRVDMEALHSSKNRLLLLVFAFCLS
jgi:hypothetical protein